MVRKKKRAAFISGTSLRPCVPAYSTAQLSRRIPQKMYIIHSSIVYIDLYIIYHIYIYIYHTDVLSAIVSPPSRPPHQRKQPGDSCIHPRLLSDLVLILCGILTIVETTISHNSDSVAIEGDIVQLSPPPRPSNHKRSSSSRACGDCPPFEF